MTPGVAIAVASGPPRSVITAHLWHIVEAIGFLVASLGGIAISEFMQSRHRQVAGAAPTFNGGGSSLSYRPETWGTDAFAADLPTDAVSRVTLLPLVALAGAAAAGVHFVVMPDHFEESWLYGTFFLVAALSQLIYSAWLLVRPSRELLIAGVAGNLAIVVLWLGTRTVGIPLGPAAGKTEEVGGLDVLSVIFELTTAVGALALIRLRRRTVAARPSSWSPAVWAFGAVAVTAIAISTFVWPVS